RGAAVSPSCTGANSGQQRPRDEEWRDYARRRGPICPEGWHHALHLGRECPRIRIIVTPSRPPLRVFRPKPALTSSRMKQVQFVKANTKLLPVPLVPEVCLHLAEESLSIWRQTEEELGCMNVPPPWWAFAWAGGQALARYVLDHPALAAGSS